MNIVGKIGTVVRLSFSINNSTNDLVMPKCLLAELTAKIIKHRQSLLLPLTPARKRIFDSFQSSVVSIHSGLLRWSLLSSLLKVLEVSLGSLYFLSSVSSLQASVENSWVNFWSDSYKSEFYFFFVTTRQTFFVLHS